MKFARKVSVLSSLINFLICGGVLYCIKYIKVFRVSVCVENVMICPYDCIEGMEM